MKFMDIVEDELQSLNDYLDVDKYKLTPNAFRLGGVWSFFEYILFILTNRGKSLTLEIEDFVERYFDDDESKLITKEAVSKQRQKFSSDIFKDMNESFITKFMKSEEYAPHFKDKIVLIVDGSKSEIPNTPESKEWANIKENSLTNKKANRVLFSTITDAKYGIILDSIIGKSDSSERDFLKQHILNIKNMVNLKDVLLIVDAGYYSLELKLFLENQGINYIFRLSPHVYSKEISQMKSCDEIIKFQNSSPRRKQISDENLKKQAEKLLYIEGRVIKLPYTNQKGEEDEMILLTNLPQYKYNIFEIGGLYQDRWEIEVNYDKLKNKMEIENYSGKLKLTIEQDFYSSIYIFNLAMILRNNIHKHLERKNIKKREIEEKEYRTNFACLIGRIKNRLIELFTSSKTKIKQILDRIIQRGQKNIYLYDFNRSKIQWHSKIFIGKYRFNQRRII